MRRAGTEGLLRELARELTPVRPLPRLRSVLLGLGLLFAGLVLLDALLMGAAPVAGARWLDPAFLGVFAGLALCAVGASAAALAGAVPGREPARRSGLALAVAGVLLASGAGLWDGLRPGPGAEGALPLLAASVQCMGHSSALGLVPALFLCLFLARALERRPLLGAAAASVGALSLGALAVHASCPRLDPLHMLVGHWAAPLAAALVLALPLSLWVGRRRRGEA